MKQTLRPAGGGLLVVALTCAASAGAAAFGFAPYRPAPKSVGKTYDNAAAILSQFISRQMQEKKLPGVSVAIVADGQIVWQKGFGFADPAHKIPLGSGTAYQVGSLSKLFTDVAVLKLVDDGVLHLDDPISRYLPNFHPQNPFATPVTLRELMAGYSGLVREPPMELPTTPRPMPLDDLVSGLNGTTLVYWPGTHWKPSSAAFAVLGRLIERASHQTFAEFMQRQVLQPFGMANSSFAVKLSLGAKLAAPHMWTYDEPTVSLSPLAALIPPADGLVTTAPDLVSFLGSLFSGTKPSAASHLSRVAIEQLTAPQFAPAGSKTGHSLGFIVSTFNGHRLLTSTGVAPGDSAELAALPDERLGVVAITNLGGANGVTARIAQVALRLMFAARYHRRLLEIPQTTELTRETTRSLAGRYGSLQDAFDLIDEENDLFFLRVAGGPMVRVRGLGSRLIEDGRLGYGLELTPIAGGMRVSTQIFPKYELPKPPEVPAAWRPLIGEYGPDYEAVYILEKDGRLTALVDGFEYDPLHEISADIFAFPRAGAFDGERAVFERDAGGSVTAVRLGGVLHARQVLGGTEGPFFHIQPVQPIDVLRREALAAKPPVEYGQFLKPDLVDVTTLDSTIKLDIRSATTRDVLRTPVYTQAKAFLERPAAEALARAARKLVPLGYGLLIHDAYRPWYVTKIFWDATPLDKRIFVADPSQGSRHNRGCAVDLTLYDLKTGRQVPMTGHYDEMTERSYPYFPGGTSLERWDRNLLRHTMESEGFTVSEFEWWHFDYQGWQHYPILNLTFEQLSPKASASTPSPAARSPASASREDPLNQDVMVTAKDLAGNLTAANGRRYTFALCANRVSLPPGGLEEIESTVGQTLGEIASAIYTVGS